ncbi:MAG: DUF3108 domain-containing protein [Calditrichaceae bacterium]|jgi:hypothetical protein
MKNYKKSLTGIFLAMGIFLYVLLILFSADRSLVSNRLYAQEIDTGLTEKDTAESSEIKNINTGSTPTIYNNKAFRLGERLLFKIRYGFIKAGTAEMKVLSIVEENGRKMYHIQTTARSASGFDWFYKVRDVINVYIDYDRLYPFRFEKKLREGGYKADLFVDYYHADSLARVEFIRYKDDMKVRKVKLDTIKIPPYVNDILSAFYLVRNQDLQVGNPVYMVTNEKNKVYDLEIQVYKKETIEVEAGKFRCIKIEPLLKGEGIFKSKGRLTVWLSDDDYKIPVQMKTEILVGSITTELTHIIGVGDLPSRIK